MASKPFGLEKLTSSKGLWSWGFLTQETQKSKQASKHKSQGLKLFYFWNSLALTNSLYNVMSINSFRSLVFQRGKALSSFWATHFTQYFFSFYVVSYWRVWRPMISFLGHRKPPLDEFRVVLMFFFVALEHVYLLLYVFLLKCYHNRSKAFIG